MELFSNFKGMGRLNWYTLKLNLDDVSILQRDIEAPESNNTRSLVVIGKVLYDIMVMQINLAVSSLMIMSRGCG